MSTRRLAVLLIVLFVVLGGGYVGAVIAGGASVQPVVFLAIAGLLGFIFVVKLGAPGLTGQERVKFDGKGRIPFEMEDPLWARRMREGAPPAPSSGPVPRKR